MPKCSYCNKFFNDRQALGNHTRKHMYDSDEDLPLSNQSDHRDIQNLRDYDCRDQLPTNKKIKLDICIEQNLINNQENSIDIQHFDIHSLSNERSIEFNEEFVVSDEESQESADEESTDEESADGESADEESADGESANGESAGEESVTSDLSYITDIDINENVEYDAIFNGIPHNPEDIRQEFPSEEYAEFMYMITRFRAQDSLANAFIQFFNKYSKCKDKPLPSTSQAG